MNRVKINGVEEEFFKFLKNIPELVRFLAKFSKIYYLKLEITPGLFAVREDVVLGLQEGWERSI